jgi:hypothetical protein
MRKLNPVEEAKALMREATGWSLWGWLTEKRKLRTTADAAWEALESLERKVKAGWSDDLKKAYRTKDGKDIEPELKLAIERMRKADEAWREARETAEATFDESERRLSTAMAREGAAQAIEAWELTEKAIRRAEALGRKSGDHED